MKIYIVRHGQDDDSVRGGWSDTPLTALGVQQSIQFADDLLNNQNKYNIGKIYSSDLKRAKQTAEIISQKLHLPIEFLPDFREVNNGDLAGIDNKLAEEKYPNLYWRKLAWNEHYPNGESPMEFFERVSNAWKKFVCEVSAYDKNVLLVTHSGVINVINCIIDNSIYSNSYSYSAHLCAEIALKIEI